MKSSLLWTHICFYYWLVIVVGIVINIHFYGYDVITLEFKESLPCIQAQLVKSLGFLQGEQKNRSFKKFYN